MKRLTKGILIGVSTLVMLGVAGLVALNVYLHTETTRLRLQAQLSEALGLPLELTSISVGLGGVRVNGVRIPDGRRKLLEALAFSAEYRVLPLLHREVVIRRLRLEAPQVTWAQNAEGKWVLPLLPARGPRAKTKLPNATGPEETTSDTTAHGWRVTLERVEVNGGQIELLDAREQRVALATGVQMQYRVQGREDVEGTVSAASVQWRGYPAAAELQSPLHYHGREVALEGLHAQVAGGTVAGRARVQTGAPNGPWEVVLDLAEVELARVIAEMGGEAAQAGGPVSGHVEVSGALGEGGQTAGKGRLLVQGGRLKGFPLWDSVTDSISLMLPLPNLSNVRVNAGQADFHFNREKLYVDALSLENSDLRVTATGQIRTDEKIAFDAQLTVNSRLVDQIQKVARSIFTLPDGASRQTTDFKVYGTLDKPKTDLGKRFVEQQLGDQISDLFSRLTGKDKEKDREEKEREKAEKERAKQERREKKKADEAARAAVGLPPTPPASETEVR